MKKTLCILMVLVLSFFIVACGEDNGKSPKKEISTADGNTEVVNDSVDEEVFALNETAVFENLKVTATEIKESKGVEYFETETGKIYVGVKFTIENISKETQSVSSMLSFESYVDDVKNDTLSVGAAIAFDDGATLDGDIAPGKKLVGWYTIETSENWKNIEILFKEDIISEVFATFEFNK